jgi:hypothetical protein
VISLIRLLATCFGVDWLGWAVWILVLVLFGLAATDARNAKVDAATAGLLPNAIRWAGGVAFLILPLVCIGSEYLHHVDASRISGAALIALCFAREALKS